MSELQIFNGFLIAWFVLSAVTFVYLLIAPAPYGRHQRAGWGAHIGDKAGWVIMELPTVVVFGLLFFMGDRTGNAVAIAFLVMFQFHYVYRTFVFPMLLRGRETLPVAIVASGFVFNIINGYLNGRWLFTLGPQYSLSWLTDPRFLIGAVVFFTGFGFHFSSDSILRNLRCPGETDFKVPRGGLFRWVSCPNYLGEMTMWCGFAIATWSLPALAFFIWTFSNLFPRALSHHRWYRQTFPDYPGKRKAIIPYLL